MKCCTIKAGDLRHSIELQSEVQTPDGSGGVTREWQTYATPRAKITGLNGRERFEADRIESPVQYRAVIRFRDDVETRHRVLYNGRAHDIRAVIDIEERRKWLELDLTRGVAT